MKSDLFTRAAFAAAAVFSTPALFAAEPSSAKTPPPPPARPPHSAEEREQLESLGHMRRLLQMSPEQIARMRGTLDRLEKMPEDKRAELRKRIDELRTATPKEREDFLSELRVRHELLDDSARKGPSVLERHFRSLSPDEAKAEREKFLAMSREERIAYVRALRKKFGLPENSREPGERRRDGRPEHKSEEKNGSAKNEKTAADPAREREKSPPPGDKS